MTDSPRTFPVREDVERRLAKRYRAELRFRSAGLAAIAVAVAILCILIGSIASEGVPAFTAKELVLRVELEAERVDPEGDGSEASLRRGSYNRVLQDALRAQFPGVTARNDVRSLFNLYTPLNATRLMDAVLRDPALVGTSHVFTMPLADDLDLYLKGRLVEDRSLPVAGSLTASPVGDGVELRSTSADFGSLVREVVQSMGAEARTLELRAEQVGLIVDQVPAEDAARLLAEADRHAAAAARLRTLALAEDGLLPLTGDVPSVIVETGGQAFRLTQLAMDGHAARGEAVLGDGVVDQATGWTLYVVDTPEVRRRVSDQLIIWTRALVERGMIQTGFNTYLFTNADSREPELAGVKGALYGSILTMIITMFLSVPIGVFTAVYLEEYAPKNRVTDFIEVNINNLAAVPSIVFGLLGLAVFINFFGLPRSAPLVGGLVLSLMTLPTVIIATRAALKAVPPSIRQAALGIGASKTQSVFHHVLPLAAPGILTGSIIGLAQALGETAPLLMIGMVAFIADAPSLGLAGFTEPATVMPVQIFLWSDGAERAFEARTAAAILILLALMIGFNAVAIYLRRRFERRW
ncbi:phosphate ABC transporter permease PstA [uncultured Maricaulis sp.]|uniref:phosphate ABC transporter permease PstA n=1 Tax=uncultured Maricaulis sp. TaxID=174710 RepID=UPI0030DBCBE8|tara:strand:+ start:71769 stop:73511 length:1743 start_codon:yes stop_codon:yes gene_type:complete